MLAARIANAEQAILQAVEASQDDTKSSAGDKYETTREMMQQEIDRNKKALYEAGMQEQLLKQAGHVSQQTVVEAGSVVETSAGNFYISIGMGQVQIEEGMFIALSPASPLGKQFIGAVKGDQVLFNGNSYLIKAIF
ncbi:MAG: 3-oxoacyl-ACP synthase [Sphingobacteriales bacterium]|nr:MAG: 3-oxoacyl-ACP synthase [Sphingobacteriales bacterium]